VKIGIQALSSAGKKCSETNCTFLTKKTKWTALKRAYQFLRGLFAFENLLIFSILKGE
jgi:hypothetical protein